MYSATLLVACGMYCLKHPTCNVKGFSGWKPVAFVSHSWGKSSSSQPSFCKAAVKLPPRRCS